MELRRLLETGDYVVEKREREREHRSTVQRRTTRRGGCLPVGDTSAGSGVGAGAVENGPSPGVTPNHS